MAILSPNNPRKYWQDRNQWFDDLYTKTNWFDRLLRKDVYFRMAVAIQVCSEFPGASVLDIGCGSGQVAKSLLLRAQAAHVTGVDFSSSMLKLAREVFSKEGLSEKARWIEGDIFGQDFRDRFDVVLALGVFDYVRESKALWRRMVSLSKYAVVASFPAPQFPRANLRRLRYGLRGCPVFFYDRQDLEALTAGKDAKIEVLRGQAGHIVIARKAEG